MKMQLTTFAAGCLAALLLTDGTEGATLRKVALLTGSQESPTVDTPASGCALMEIDTDANLLTYRIVFGGLLGNESVAHFHGPADPGMNAGVLHALPVGNPKSGVWNYPDDVEDDLLAGKIYINIHSTMHPGGELRGQVVDMVALIDGNQENPAVATDAKGVGLFMIDTCANELDYHIVFEDLIGKEIAAHIHGFALHGTNAGVLHELPAGSPKTGTWNYDQGQEQRLLNGRAYVNIHSSEHGGGEIRGQITRLVVPIDGQQEPTPVATSGHGCGLFAINLPASTLSYYVSWADLTGPATAAHIHGFAPAGVNAGVQQSIGTALPAIGEWEYGDANEESVTDGLTYINVHSAMHGGGEIRGQVTFPPAPCVADVDCSGAVDVDDLVEVILQWGTSDPDADINDDGTVNVDDLVAVILGWGSCP